MMVLMMAVTMVFGPGRSVRHYLRSEANREMNLKCKCIWQDLPVTAQICTESPKLDSKETISDTVVSRGDIYTRKRTEKAGNALNRSPETIFEELEYRTETYFSRV